MRLCALLLAALLGNPLVAGAQDRWLASDKAQHFVATAAIAAGGYTLAATVIERERWRIAIGAGAGIGAATAKELLWDRSRGRRASWRDFTWSAIGTATGALVAHAIDRVRH
jgi:putative lipoprotein